MARTFVQQLLLRNTLQAAHALHIKKKKQWLKYVKFDIINNKYCGGRSKAGQLRKHKLTISQEILVKGDDVWLQNDKVECSTI